MILQPAQRDFYYVVIYGSQITIGNALFIMLLQGVKTGVSVKRGCSHFQMQITRNINKYTGQYY